MPYVIKPLGGGTSDMVYYPISETTAIGEYEGQLYPIFDSVNIDAETQPYHELDYFEESDHAQHIALHIELEKSLKRETPDPYVYTGNDHEAPKSCTCDFHTVLLRTGCQCGGR